MFKFYNGKQFACAGAFFVEKSNGLLRIIVDAREANAWMAPPGNNFTMVTVEQITSVFARLRAAHERFYTVTADLRHWFRQMGLPMRWFPFFICKLRANRFVKPVATPMGWVDSPRVGTAATWSMLLASDDGQPAELSRDSGIPPGFIAELRGDLPAFRALALRRRHHSHHRQRLHHHGGPALRAVLAAAHPRADTALQRAAQRRQGRAGDTVSGRGRAAVPVHGRREGLRSTAAGEARDRGLECTGAHHQRPMDGHASSAGELAWSTSVASPCARHRVFGRTPQRRSGRRIASPRRRRTGTKP
jgi:hypothetical protein